MKTDISPISTNNIEFSPEELAQIEIVRKAAEARIAKETAEREARLAKEAQERQAKIDGLPTLFGVTSFAEVLTILGAVPATSVVIQPTKRSYVFKNKKTVVRLTRSKPRKARVSITPAKARQIIAAHAKDVPMSEVTSKLGISRQGGYLVLERLRNGLINEMGEKLAKPAVAA